VLSNGKMALNLNVTVARMRVNTHVVAALCADVDEQQARWRPTPEAWSMLEVVCHLVDEECEDFRRRVDLTLHAPEQAWPPIRPVEWVHERGYALRALPQELNHWLAEREASAAWLLGLHEPDWNSSHAAPGGASLRAGDLLAAWLAHDFLHIRQLTELQHAWHAQQAAPYACGYAGDI
jgi:hypothetical protein